MKTNNDNAMEQYRTLNLSGDGLEFSVVQPSSWFVKKNLPGSFKGALPIVEFYQEGPSTTLPTAKIWVNTISLETSQYRSFESLMKEEAIGFKSAIPDLQITEGKDLVIPGGLSAKVRHHSSEARGFYEVRAYINAGKIVVLMDLTSEKKEGIDGSFAAFEELVKSYKILGQGQEPKSFSISDKGIHYRLSVPSGWFVSKDLQRENKEATAVLYSKTDGHKMVVATELIKPFEKLKYKSTEAVISNEVAYFKANFPDIQLTDAKDIVTADGVTAQIKYFFLSKPRGEQEAFYEVRAYIPAQNALVTIDLSVGTRQEFDAEIPAFNELVKSYAALGVE